MRFESPFDEAKKQQNLDRVQLDKRHERFGRRLFKQVS